MEIAMVDVNMNLLVKGVYAYWNFGFKITLLNILLYSWVVASAPPYTTRCIYGDQ